MNRWRHGSESNRRIEVLQTSALPLDDRAQHPQFFKKTQATQARFHVHFAVLAEKLAYLQPKAARNVIQNIAYFPKHMQTCTFEVQRTMRIVQHLFNLIC